MSVKFILIAIIGLIVAPVIHGLTLYVITNAIGIVANGSQIRFRTLLWLRSGIHAIAGIICATTARSAMQSFGYLGGWIWLAILSFYFIQNFYYRNARNMLEQDGAFLLIFDILGIWVGGLALPPIS